MEEIAHKFNMQRMRQKNNVTTKLTKRDVPKHKPSDSKYSTLKDAMSISHKNEIDSNMNRNNKRKQKSRVVSIISNHVVVGTFTIEADKLSTAKFLVKIPAKELDDDDMLSNEVDSDFEEDLQSDEGVVRIVDVPDVMVDTSHNLYDTILHCGDDLDKFISQSKSILEGIELWFDSNNNDEEDGNSLGCSKLQKDQHAFYEVVFMGLVIMCIKYISKTNNPILLHNLVECAQVLYENVILMQNEKENGIPNKIQMANSKQLTKEEVCFRMHSNITRVDYLLKDSVNYIYIFYKDLTKDDQHLNGNGIFHDNDDLNNIEYLFDLLKNPLRQKDIRSTIYNDFLITNLISFKVYDDTFKEFKDSDSNNDEGIPSIPFLPQIKDKMGYTLVIDLDETLVHFVEENGEAFVQVRPYSEFFLSEMSKYFEIVIFTAATEDVRILI